MGKGHLVPVKKLVSPPGKTPHLRTYYINPEKDKKKGTTDKGGDGEKFTKLKQFFDRAGERLAGKLNGKNLFREYGFDKAKDLDELRGLVRKVIDEESKKLVYNPDDLFRGTFLLASAVFSNAGLDTIKKLVRSERFKRNFYERATEAFGIYGERLEATGPHAEMWYQLASSYAVLRHMGFSRDRAAHVHSFLQLPHVAPESADMLGFMRAAASGEIARGILYKHLSYTEDHKKIGVRVLADLMKMQVEEGKSLDSGSPFQRGFAHLYKTTQAILQRVGKKLKNTTFYRGMTIPSFVSPIKIKSGRTQSISMSEEVGAFFAGLYEEGGFDYKPLGAYKIELPEGYFETFENIDAYYSKEEMGLILRMRGLKDPRRVIFSMTPHTVPYYERVYKTSPLFRRMAEEEQETLIYV